MNDRKQDTHVKGSWMSLRRVGVESNWWELGWPTSCSRCSRAILSISNSFSSTKSPLLILSTTLAGTAGRADESISGGALQVRLSGVGPRGPRAGSAGSGSGGMR